MYLFILPGITVCDKVRGVIVILCLHRMPVLSFSTAHTCSRARFHAVLTVAVNKPNPGSATTNTCQLAAQSVVMQ